MYKKVERKKNKNNQVSWICNLEPIFVSKQVRKTKKTKKKQTYSTKSLGGLIVNSTENGIGYQSSNHNCDSLHSLYTFGRDMNLLLLMGNRTFGNPLAFSSSPSWGSSEQLSPVKTHNYNKQ